MTDLEALQRGRDYHLWYYNSQVWQHVTYLGVPCQKSVSDLWNYQEILTELKPALVVELGTNRGGSALYFAHVLSAIRPDAGVLTVDIEPERIHSLVREHPRIQCLYASTTDPIVSESILRQRTKNPGLIFAILDSDHARAHVLGELMLLRTVLRAGDYVIVEDMNINGHPVLPDSGPGPMEALAEYERMYPTDYTHDAQREQKFGFTFAPNGFLIRTAVDNPA